MTDYNDGKWHGWNGGECPVDPDSIVDIRWGDPKRDGTTSRAGAWREECWGHVENYEKIIAFRVTKPAPPKPREWWMFHTGGLAGFKVFDYEDYAKREANGRLIIHVIEKLPE